MASSPLPKNASAWVDGYYVGYLQNLLPPEQIDWSGLTHITMSRVKANADGTLNMDFDIGIPAGQNLATKIAQYAHENNTQAILMIGGAGNGADILGAVQDNNRTTFIANLVSAKQNLGYDGYDLDWEDNINYTLFVKFAQQLREADPNATITMPVGPINSNYQTVDPGIVAVSPYVDQINLMSYFPATTWSGDGWDSWFVSPLSDVKSTTPIAIDDSLSRYAAAGIPKSKLGMGIGFHAIGYINGITGPDQPTVSNSIIGGDNVYPLSKLFGTGGAYNQNYRFWDSAANEPYLSLPEPDPFGAKYVSFEDEQSLLAKGNFTLTNGYGGTIIWTINEGYVPSHSDPNFLFHALRKGFIDPNTTLTVAVSTIPQSAYVINGTTTEFSALVTGTPDKNVTWSVRETGCGTISPDGAYDGNYTAPESAVTGQITTCHITAISTADPTKQAVATVYTGDAKTLTWDPGLYRTNCAEWWMEVYANDTNTTSLEIEHNGTWITMTPDGTINGKPDFSVSTQVESGDIIQFRATSSDGQTATTVPITYSFTAAGEADPCPIQPLGPDLQPPGSVSNLHAVIIQPTYITWEWIDPTDVDFAEVQVFINGTASGTVLKGTGFFNVTGLVGNTSYTISTRTQDTSNNVNLSWVNDTVTTPLNPDTQPPMSVTNLSNSSSGSTYMIWSWTDPPDADFAAVQVYIDGTFRSLIPKGTGQFMASLLNPDTNYTISTRTVDIVGNINSTWINSTAQTLPLSSAHWVDGYYVGYLQNLLSPEQIYWGGMTHIVMSRVKANADGTLNMDFDIGIPAGQNLATKIAQYAHENNTQAILMIGGAENGADILGAVQDNNRTTFIANLVSAKQNLGYDGYDLDWEDNVNYTLFATFAQQLRESDPTAIITMPVGPINSNYQAVDPQLVNVTQYVDQVNMMSYYPATTWAGSGWDSWFNSPLSGVKPTTPIAIDDSLSRYAAAGIPKSKLGMGIGFYAIGYTGNVTGPDQPTEPNTIVGGDNVYPLSTLFGTSGAYNQNYRFWDSAAYEPYLSLPEPDSFGAQYVSFEDEQSILAKGNFTRTNDYGGTIVWTINEGYVPTHSDPNFLMHALRKGFIDPSYSLTPAVSVNPPLAYVVAGTNTQFRALVTGIDNRNVTWNVVEPGGGTITRDGIYSAPLGGEPNVTTTYHITATSQGNPAEIATADVVVGNAAAIEWNPELYRMNCAEWWMEVWSNDPNTTSMELEHNGVLYPMTPWSAYWGLGYPLPNFAANVQVEQGDTIRIHATRSDGRTAVTIPINYTWTASGEVLPCPIAPLADPPGSQFTSNITSGTSPLTVQFTDTSTASPTSWLWNFGDGGTSTAENPVHTYSIPGTYNVSLEATNEEGSNTTTNSDYISVVEPSQWVPVGGTVAIGESGLDISAGMAGNTTIAWWPAGANITSTAPTTTISVGSTVHNFAVTPAEFSGYTGPWYSYNESPGTPLLAFQVVNPSVDITIRDLSVGGTDVTGKTVPVGDELGFEITTNTVNITTERNISAVPFTILLTGPDGRTIPTLVSKAGTVNSLSNITVLSSPYNTGGFWDLGNTLYRTGTYTVQIEAETSLNGMQDTSLNQTVTLSTTAGAVTPLPVIASVPTASGYRNNTAAFTILGNNFEPGSGNTTVEFRNQSTGVIPTTLTNITPTRIDGTIAIPANVINGSWNIQVVTVNGGVNTTTNVFTIGNIPKPTITSVAPTTPWYLNATVPFLITGTNFEPSQPGQTTVTFSYPSNGTALNITNGFTVNTITATTINGTVVVPFGAPTGTWNVSVTTVDGGTVWNSSAFTVKPFQSPTIQSITPPGGNWNTTVLFTINGTNFEPGETTVTISNDVTDTVLPATIFSIAPTTPSTPTTVMTMIGSVQIPNTTPAGSYNLNVTTVDGGTIIKAGAFEVGSPSIPTIISLTPGSGKLDTIVAYSINGTNFQPGETTVAFVNQTTGATLTATYNATSATQILGNVTIPSNALTGPYRLDIITPDGGDVNLPDGFTVGYFPAPTITSLTPGSGYQNSTVVYSIVGSNFEPGKTTVAFANQTTGIPLNSTIMVNTVNGTTISGSVVVPFNAPTGAWNASVTTVDGGTVWQSSALTVNAFPAPIISSLTPVTGTKNSTVAFTIYGNNFEPEPSGTSVRIVDDTSGTVFPAPIIYINQTTIVGNFTILPNVPAGYYRLEVTTVDGGVNSTLNAFKVTYLPLPIMTALTPNSGNLDSTVPFTLTGNYFLNGGTVVMLRTVGTTLNATPYLTWVNTTTIQGSFVINNTAEPGPYTLYVITTGGGFNSTPEAFMVGTFAQPTITGVTPKTWYRNATVPFQINGTKFGPGQMTVAFVNPSTGTPLNSTIMVNTVTATTINGTVVVPFNAPTGTGNVSVTTADGVTVWKSNVFTVSNFPAPSMPVIAPNTLYRNTTVIYTINGGYFEPGQTTVVMSNPISGELATTLYSVTPSQIVGGVQIPATASLGVWKLNVTTFDGGLTSNLSAFTVTKLPVPAITAFSPSTAYQNTTVSFILTGNYFEPGGLTTVNLTKPGQPDIPTTLTSVYSSSITGTVAIPGGNTTGSWNVNVTTLDGGTGTKSNAISIL
jgi:GH18 family chitinase/PKD repeat protein